MKERLPVEKMPGLLRPPHPLVPLGWYEHARSGKPYVVVGGTFLATGEEQEVHVQYVCPENGYSAHRTAVDFLEVVPGVGARFRLLGPLGRKEVAMILIQLILKNLGVLPWLNAPGRYASHAPTDARDTAAPGGGPGSS